MTDKDKSDILRDLYGRALERQTSRGNAFEQKSATLVGFLGATVGIFIGTLMPDLLSEEFLSKAVANCAAFILWTFSMLSFAIGLAAFIVFVWHWRQMISPEAYMWPDPNSYRSIEDLDAIREEHLNDLDKSLRHNTATVNMLGTQFIKIKNIIMIIILALASAAVFYAICKLSI